MSRFVVLIKNDGNVSVIIKKIELYIVVGRKKMLLEEKSCVCDYNGKVIVIEPKKAYSYIPIKGSIYDILGYKGHYFDVTDNNKKKVVFIKATDIQKKTYKSRTVFTLEEVDIKFSYHIDSPLD